MVKGRVNFDLIFGDVDDFLGVFDNFEGVMLNIFWFNKVHFTKVAFAQEFDYSVLIDFSQLHDQINNIAASLNFKHYLKAIRNFLTYLFNQIIIHLID